VARAGRLRVPVDIAAVMVHSCCVGVSLNLIGTPEKLRDTGISVRVREAVFTAIVEAGPPVVRAGDAVPSRALALDAALAEQPAGLTPAETALLRQWLHRLATAGQGD
jgi:hypothetical protein